MKHRSEGATALLGMPGFVVGAQMEIDGERWLHVETTADVVGCSACGTRAVGHGRRRVVVRDLPMAGRPVVAVWAKRILRCPEPDCEAGTWTESHPAIASRACLTERAREEICRRVGEDEDSVAQVARAFGVGWHSAMAAVEDHGRPLVEDPGRLEEVGALGLDETKFLSATPEHRTEYVTGFVDLDRVRLLDIVPGRSARAVQDWLGARPSDWLEAIEVVALDPHRGYANGLLTHLGHAEVVIDHFHAVALANRAIDDVRRRVQQDTLGHRGRSGDPLYGIRRQLLIADERLSARGFERMKVALDAGDPEGEVGATWVGKELLRAVYAADSFVHARSRLMVFYDYCSEAEVPELSRLATTVSAWQDQILAYHTTGLSNGPTEAVNLLIEKVRRIGHGFRSIRNYRLRLLLRCGVTWQTRPAARIRGRQPRLVA
ncbi:MAG: ISL3 family transposase [Actinomycetota bacterium]|nr:ISL3 family transposase [Actinomycetota bacterium]